MQIYNYFPSTNNTYIPINTNQILESNKSYLATSNVTIQLPYIPTIGDVISLATNSNISLTITLRLGITLKNFVTGDIITDSLLVEGSQSAQLLYQANNMWAIIYTTNTSSIVI